MVGSGRRLRGRAWSERDSGSVAKSAGGAHDEPMPTILVLPAHGDVVLDSRGEGRALRVTWHHEGEVVVLSLWHGGTCSGTFRLARDDVPALVSALVAGLSEGYHRPAARRRAG